MKKIYTYLILTLCFLFLTNLSPSEASAKIYKGKAGKQAVWKYNSQTKILTVSGKGAVSKTIIIDDDNFHAYTDAITVKKIVIQEGITSIDNCHVFEWVSGSAGVSLLLPDSLKEIATASFQLNIEHLTIPKNLKNIAPGAFMCCTIQKISVSDANKYFMVKENVLFSKDGTSLICYPDGNKEMTYRIPDSVKEISPLAFAENRNIKKIVLHKNLNVLGSGAFFNCSNLSQINLECADKLKKLSDFDGYKINYYRHVWSELNEDDDPPLYYDYIQTSPGNTAKLDGFYLGTFEGTAVSSIRIPDHVKYLAEDTFQDCFYLKKITFGKNFIGEINNRTKDRERNVRLYELNLDSVRFAEGNQKYCVKNNILYSFDGGVLYQVLKRNKQHEFVINKNVTQIADGAFCRMENLDRIIVEGSIKKLGQSAFAGSRINSFLAKGNIQEICKGAFRYCRSLERFECKGKIGIVDAEAFYDCENLKEVIVPEKPSQVHDSAFGGWSD